MNTSPHPPRDQLVAFGQGRLDADTAESIADHVSDCDSCCEVLSEVPSDTLADQVRAADADTTVDLQTGNPATGQTSPDRMAVPEDLVDHPRYRIVRVLGAGGMGTVFQAEHRIMDRPVALKVINRDLTSDPEVVQRFRQEVRAAAKLSHPGIVTAHDAEQTGELHFLVMEYVDGVDLARYVKRKGPLSPGLVAHIGRQVAMGLEHAARQGMVHRDIKPQNLMMTKSGRVQILDFGLARLGRKETERDDSRSDEDLLKQSAASLTLAGSILGTPDYIAPEQATDSRHADIRADIYSLGCTLYFLLTGRPPFPGGSVLNKLLAHQKKTPTPIAEIRPEVPDRLIDIVERMMSRLPGDRFDSPGQAAKALQPLVKELKSAPVALTEESVRSTASGDRAEREPAPLRKSPSLLRTLMAAVTRTWTAASAMQRAGAVLAASLILALLVKVSLPPGEPVAPDPQQTERPGETGRPSISPPAVTSQSSFTAGQIAAARALGLNDAVVPIALGPGPSGEERLLNLIVLPGGQCRVGTTEPDLNAITQFAEQTGDPLPSLEQTIRNDEMPAHDVRIPETILIGQTEVTTGQFLTFVTEKSYITDAERTQGWGMAGGNWVQREGFSWKNGGDFTPTDSHPATSISWYDAIAFCEWLTEKQPLVQKRRVRFRLPTESEWEYACRAGSSGPWFFADGSKLTGFAVCAGNSDNRPQSVASFQPNPFGLFDMLGNECEWCLDPFRPYESAPRVADSAHADQMRDADSGSRVQRGGNFQDTALAQRSAARRGGDPHSPSRGAFRVVAEFLD